MKVTFDKDGYVEMLVMKGDLPNSVELPDDDTLNYKYLNCYKLGFEGTQLVLDAKKVQRIESNLSAETLIYDLQKQINSTDYKVLRRIRELALGIPTSMSKDDYIRLEAERESIVRKIREIQDGTKLQTDANVIYQEGIKVREEEQTKEDTIAQTVDKIVPQLEKDVDELKKKNPTDELDTVEQEAPQEMPQEEPKKDTQEANSVEEKKKE